ncbi:alkaline shock response membrane anchor protein AmaP [Streptomyces sp. NPDC087425]|uniref:alkaline shock response membrane anchor protein AmaP n=1 Tax=Streptomyces sp. NPDC087425 TaxID=3365787 RepID=UPI003818DC1D
MRTVLSSVNRVLIGLVGLVLFLAGGSVLAVGLGAKPPAWWVYGDRHDVLLSDAARTRWRSDGWWWPTVLAILAVLVLLALWWLSAVLRRRRLGEVLIDTGDGESALLRGRALEDALAGQTSYLDGVRATHVRLTGRRTAPEAHVSLLLEPHTDPGTTLHTLTTKALTPAQSSTGLNSLPTTIHIKAAKHRPERVN